ncbi:MAG TPA: hypothetical protein VF292_09645 [Rhodanobacteraceae bacterium]
MLRMDALAIQRRRANPGISRSLSLPADGQRSAVAGSTIPGALINAAETPVIGYQRTRYRNVARRFSRKQKKKAC